MMGIHRHPSRLAPTLKPCSISPKRILLLPKIYNRQLSTCQIRQIESETIVRKIENTLPRIEMRFYDPVNRDLASQQFDFSLFLRTLSTVRSSNDKFLENTHDYIQILFPLPERSIFVQDAPVVDASTCHTFRTDPELRKQLMRAVFRMLKFYLLSFERQGPQIVNDTDQKISSFAFDHYPPPTPPLPTDSNESPKPTTTTTAMQDSPDLSSTSADQEQPQPLITYYASRRVPYPYCSIHPTREIFKLQSSCILRTANHNHLRLTRIIRSCRLLGLGPAAEELYRCLMNLDREFPNRIGRKSLEYWRRAARRPLWISPDHEDGVEVDDKQDRENAWLKNLKERGDEGGDVLGEWGTVWKDDEGLVWTEETDSATSTTAAAADRQPDGEESGT